MIRFSLALSVAILLTAPDASGQLRFSDGSEQTTAALELTTVVTVQSDGTATENGAALLTAISGLNSTPKVKVVLLEPGTYDVGTSSVDLIDGLTLHGFGHENTTVTGDGAVTLNGADQAHVRSLQVQNTGTDTTVFAQAAGETDLFGVWVNHAGTASSGTCYGVRVTAGGDVGLNDHSRVDFTGTAAGGTFIGVSVSGSDGLGGTSEAEVSSFTHIDAEVVSGTVTIIGLNLGAGTDVDVEQNSQIDLFNPGNPTIGISVGSGASVSVSRSEVSVDNGSSIINDGTVFASDSEFNGSVSGTGSEVYVHCTTGNGVPIANTNAAVATPQ